MFDKIKFFKTKKSKNDLKPRNLIEIYKAMGRIVNVALNSSATPETWQINGIVFRAKQPGSGIVKIEKGKGDITFQMLDWVDDKHPVYNDNTKGD